MTRKFQFYIVPTPIGNIADITLRALEVLRNVDLIACEDTRVTQKLLNHYNIQTKCISYHKYNERERVNRMIEELNNGQTIALVSDAGTPQICDPGNVIIQELQKNNISYTSLPGACAVTTFLSQISRTGEDFSFIGFIPRTKEQICECLKRYYGQNIIFYDSPERILKTLDIIKTLYGDIQISLGRELSKLFEEIKNGTITEIIDYYKTGIKGEIICMLHKQEVNEENDFSFKITDLKKKNFKDKEIAVILSTLYNVNKNDIYKQILQQ